MKPSLLKRTRYVPARKPCRRVGPDIGLVASRSTGPVAVTVTPSSADPVGSVMNSNAVVVAPEAGRGFGFVVWVAGLGLVGDGLGGAVCGGACSKVNSRRTTMGSMLLRRPPAAHTSYFLRVRCILPRCAGSSLPSAQLCQSALISSLEMNSHRTLCMCDVFAGSMFVPPSKSKFITLP